LEHRVEFFIQMLDSIWHKEMGRRFVRLQKATVLYKGHRITPYDQHLLKESLYYLAEVEEQIPVATHVSAWHCAACSEVLHL
jgi:hypothetical protein